MGSANRMSIVRFFLRLRLVILLKIIAIVTARINKVPNALISGFSPSRVRENTTNGKVDEPGPDKNAEITTLSIEMVNDNNQPEMSACEINGKVISKNALSGGAPKSCAASCNDLSISDKRDCTVIVT